MLGRILCRAFSPQVFSWPFLGWAHAQYFGGVLGFAEDGDVVRQEGGDGDEACDDGVCLRGDGLDGDGGPFDDPVQAAVAEAHGLFPAPGRCG